MGGARESEASLRRSHHRVQATGQGRPEDEEPRGSRSHLHLQHTGLVISPAILATCRFHLRFTAHPQHLIKIKADS